MAVWHTAETNRGAVPSVQSLSAAGQHILPSEKEVRVGNPIDLMVCLHFHDYRSSWVMLHDNCVTVWCTQALWIWYLHSLCVHAIIIALFSSRVSCFPSLVFLFILTKHYLLFCKGTSQKIHKIYSCAPEGEISPSKLFTLPHFYLTPEVTLLQLLQPEKKNPLIKIQTPTRSYGWLWSIVSHFQPLSALCTVTSQSANSLWNILLPSRPKPGFTSASPSCSSERCEF